MLLSKIRQLLFLALLHHHEVIRVDQLLISVHLLLLFSVLDGIGLDSDALVSF
jgi:hypothetical protein